MSDQVSNQNTIAGIRHRYAFGDCAMFAAAMSRRYDLPLVEFYDENGGMFHVAVVPPQEHAADPANERFLDVFGETTKDDIMARYHICGDVEIHGRTEREMHQMSLFEESDVLQALKDIDLLIAAQVLPDTDAVAYLNGNSKTKRHTPQASRSPG